MKAQKRTASPSLTSYNDLVQKTYDGILKQAEQLLASLEQEELRYVLERTESGTEYPIIRHELVSPVLYLRLQFGEDSRLSIHFGAEPSSPHPEVQAVTARFLRTLFASTCKAHTGVDIEDCVRTDWFINTCSEMYEYLEGSARHHAFRKVPFKRHAARKRVLKLA
ncbi:MAG: hypothetical protein ACTHMI_15020 [Mucilaginibacter sp.]